MTAPSPSPRIAALGGLLFLLCQPGGTGLRAQAPGDTATAAKVARQVEIISDDPGVRVAFTNFADRLHSEVRQMLRDPSDAWKFPLKIHVSGNANDVVTGATAVIPREITLLPDGRIDLRMHVRLHNRYDQKEVDHRFIQLLLYEMMTRQYADQPNAFDQINLQVPYWLIRGIDELIRHRSAGRPSDLFAGLVNARQLLPVAEILNRKADEGRVDPMSDALFGASAAALVAALLDQENGADSLRGYLSSLTAPNQAPETATLLRENFPGLRGSDGALEKWWSLQIASMGLMQAFEYHSAGETAALLEQALTVDLPEESPPSAGGIRKYLPQAKRKGSFQGRVHDFDRFLDHEGGRDALEQSRLRLRTLGLRAFPLYKGVVLRYELAVTSLINGRERGVADDLAQLDRESAGIEQAMSRVEDYMNFIEATEAEGGNPAYENYRRMREKLDRERGPERKDRISRYLDALEQEFQEP